MPREVILSAEAIEGFAEVVEYLEREFGTLVAGTYRKRLELTLARLAVLPASAPLLDKRKDIGLHKCVLERNTIILYRYTDYKLEVENIHDARTDWK